MATFGTDYGFNSTYPSYVESPVARHNKYIKIRIENEGDFWGECDLMYEQDRKFAIEEGFEIPSQGSVYYDMAKKLRVSPDFLHIDGEYELLNRFNRISKPSYIEYDNLPAKWVDISGLIEKEINTAMEALQAQRNKK